MPEPEFIAARPVVRWAGQEDARFGEALLDLTVVLPAEGMDRLELRVVDVSGPDAPRPFAFDDLELGDSVEVLMGSSSAPVSVFSGECTALEAVLGQGAPQLVALAEDRLHRLAKARHSRVFENATLADVVRQVASDHGLSADCDLGLQGTWHQLGESDLAFLRRVLAARALAPRLVSGVLTAKAPEPAASPIALDARSNAQRVRLSADLARQATSMSAHGYDVAQGRAVSASASALDPAPVGASAVAELNRIGWDAGDHALQPAVSSQAQGDAQAQAMLARRGAQFVSGELTCDGNPQLRPGAGVRLAGVPSRFGGDYSVASCVHRFDQAHGYRTLVRLARGGLATGGSA
jgi:phage protein D